MASDSRDYRLDLAGLISSDVESAENRDVGRPYLSVFFACCAIYTRIYRNAEGTAYRGRCPRCGRAVNFRVGPQGTDSRFFVVH